MENNISSKKENEITYIGWFDDKPKKLDITKFTLCTSCNGSGESKDEFPVRCLECSGDGYNIKK